MFKGEGKHMKPYHGILAAVCCTVLSGCYFNSAGRLVDSASYQAKYSRWRTEMKSRRRAPRYPL